MKLYFQHLLWREPAEEMYTSADSLRYLTMFEQ